jgi:carbonic anhydrase/acetyltransferase-like protein (isoleucine patch superfamily)
MECRRTLGIVLLAGLAAGTLAPASVASPPRASESRAQAREAAQPVSVVVAAAAERTCSPTRANRPVCPAEAPLATASFLDPTVRVRGPVRVRLGEQVYVGPFARLRPGPDRAAPIVVGDESNLQDGVWVAASVRRSAGELRRLAAAGLPPGSGARTGARVILAHGSSVRGPARLGVVAPGETPPEPDSGVFVSFGAQVDGAVLERDTGLSVLSRVGPGVRLRSGMMVLPGKNVVNQAQADDPALGKVRPLTEADRLFNEAVVHVNVGLAREYTRLAREDPTAVRGLNLDPGGNDFNRTREAPSVESDLCTGPQVRRPGFRNRVIGDVCFADPLRELRAAMGRRDSLRADEGAPFGVGEIAEMGDGVVFHALEHSDLRVGDRVRYGDRVVVHGGGRPTVDPTTGAAPPTVVGDDVRLGDDAVVFRSLVRNRVRIGARSAVVGSELAVGQRIPPRIIYANDEVFGPVEW